MRWRAAHNHAAEEWQVGFRRDSPRSLAPCSGSSCVRVSAICCLSNGRFHQLPQFCDTRAFMGLAVGSLTRSYSPITMADSVCGKDRIREGPAFIDGGRNLQVLFNAVLARAWDRFLALRQRFPPFAAVAVSVASPTPDIVAHCAHSGKDNPSAGQWLLSMRRTFNNVLLISCSGGQSPNT